MTNQTGWSDVFGDRHRIGIARATKGEVHPRPHLPKGGDHNRCPATWRLFPDHPAPQALQERQHSCPEQGADRKGDEEREAHGQRCKMIGGEIKNGQGC